MPKWVFDCLNIAFAMVLVVFNGFFVAAEFALVKVRKGRLDELLRKRRPFAETARWLFDRMDPTLSACQLGITIASLGLGWIGEPAFVLRMAGVGSASEHEAVHSEEEIRALLSHAHKQGEMTPSEHRLLNAIFEFDDLVCRKVMIPRNDVTFLDVDSRLSDCIETAKKTKHSRYPICEGSLAP